MLLGLAFSGDSETVARDGDLEVGFLDARKVALEHYESSPLSYLTLDDNGRVLEANTAACALLGLERAALMRKPLTAFMDAADAAVFGTLVCRVPHRYDSASIEEKILDHLAARRQPI